MSRPAQIITHVFVIVELIFYFLVPYLLISEGLSIFHAVMAGWTVGFLTPAVGLQHEWVHLKKKWYTSVLFELIQYFCYSFIIVFHHKYSHHKHANTLKDYGHPYKNRGQINYFFNYLINPIPKLFRIKPLRFSVLILGAIVSSVIIFSLFGWHGIAYQAMASFGFYYTVGSGNYVQHYGLELLPISDAQKITYAWDDIGEVGKYFGFNLHIHSDHHLNTYKPFDKLKHLKGKPVVPYGIPVLAVIFPFPIIKKVMNKRLDTYLSRFEKGEDASNNIQ